jgi:hypothetical protein
MIQKERKIKKNHPTRVRAEEGKVPQSHHTILFKNEVGMEVKIIAGTSSSMIFQDGKLTVFRALCHICCLVDEDFEVPRIYALKDSGTRRPG